MTGLALMFTALGRVPAISGGRGTAGLAAGPRYVFSALGPISVSAAHFLAALLFLHTLPREAFGLFSFLLVVSPFCLSLCGAAFSPPIALWSAPAEGMAANARMTLLKANCFFSLVATLAVAAVMLASGADVLLALLMGTYGGAMSARWFARCLNYAETRTLRVLTSDLAYSTLLCVILLSLSLLREIDIWTAAWALLSSAIAGLLVLIAGDGIQYVRAMRCGSLAPFFKAWREMSGWAVLGVVFSELAVNAHAYLVTFIAGPHAFAVLALGSLLMRPVSLVLAALPDMERPLMSRALVAGEPQRAFGIVKEFRTAAGAIWLATAAIAAVLLIWFPHLLVKKDYALRDVAMVVSIAAAIMALRTFRTPESVLLQAAGEFRRLAGVGALASVTSVLAAFALLVFAGPVAALFGILLGEMVAFQRTFALLRQWRVSHG